MRSAWILGTMIAAGALACGTLLSLGDDDTTPPGATDAGATDGANADGAPSDGGVADADAGVVDRDHCTGAFKNPQPAPLPDAAAQFTGGLAFPRLTHDELRVILGGVNSSTGVVALETAERADAHAPFGALSNLQPGTTT